MVNIKDGNIIKAEDVVKIIKSYGFDCVIEDFQFVDCSEEELINGIKGLYFTVTHYNTPQVEFKDLSSSLVICVECYDLKTVIH